jgi:two-component system LytT family sensor kinase
MKIETATRRFLLYVGMGTLWLLLLTTDSLLNEPGIRVPVFINESWRTIYIISANFLFFEFSLPYILLKRKHILFNIWVGILLLAVQLFLVSFGLYFWRGLGIALEIYTPLMQMNLKPYDPYSLMMAGVFYQGETGIASLVFFGIIKQVYEYRKLAAVTQQLRLEKAESELHYLKSQTNPHFLFNTLNNIYALARDKSDLAAESILRLSKILRFMLYETSGAFITIAQEQEVISDYIALEQLRYDNSLRIDFRHDIAEETQQLPPLLLMPLVENAFKHGASEASGASFIDICLSSQEQQLSFEVRNTAGNEQKPLKENIGLANLRRQLQLLYTDYDLTIHHKDAVFTATLRINLASHA